LSPKRIILLLLFIYTALVTQAQADSSFAFIKRIKGQFSFFTVDNLDNVYLITEKNQLKKFTAKGDSVGVFNDVKRYGAVSMLDVTNPLKVLVYYKNFTTVLVLDRFLNTRNTINLRKQKLFAVNSVATSYDNNIWLFDEQEYKLKKVDDDGKVLQETNDFRMLFDSVPANVQVTDKNNFVYLYDSAKGFYIFDYYNNFKSKLPFLNWSNIAIAEKNIYGFAGNKLYSYQLSSLDLKAYELPTFFGSYKVIKAVNGKVYLLKDDGIDVYQVK
jgi:hypothetical protein